jgi:hypothetical protein
MVRSSENVERLNRELLNESTYSNVLNGLNDLNVLNREQMRCYREKKTKS